MNLLCYAVVALVALQRLGELWYAQRNTRRLIAMGASEVGRGHYGIIVLLHGSWLVAVALFVPPAGQVVWLWLGVFALLQVGRLWVIASLGPYWTTRIITLKAAPLVRAGPYRYLRHPNYLIVALEIAVLPLAFHEWLVALSFSILNGAILTVRLKEEEAVLAPRRLPGAAANGVEGA
jgi:methyltransferase